jgi:hypothetical protein
MGFSQLITFSLYGTNFAENQPLTNHQPATSHSRVNMKGNTFPWSYRKIMIVIILLTFVAMTLWSSSSSSSFYQIIPFSHKQQQQQQQHFWEEERTNHSVMESDRISENIQNDKHDMTRTCFVQFQDESTLLCYFSEMNGNMNRSRANYSSYLPYMLHHFFPDCLSSHLRTKDLSKLPDLRFHRRCLFVFDDIGHIHRNDPNIRPGDIYWGYPRDDISLLNEDTLSTYYVPNDTYSTTFSKLPSKEWIDSFPHHLFRTVYHQNTTAVILLGNLRGGERTWHSLYRHVLDVNHADLILVVVGNITPSVSLPGYKSSSLLSRAKFVFQIPHFDDWAIVLDMMAKDTNNTTWRHIIPTIIGNSSILLGSSSVGEETQGKIRAGSGALLFSARWILSEIIKENHFTSIYDRFVLTRSDQYYLCDNDISALIPHSKIFIPTGEDYGGICDRHLICSARDVLPILNILPPLIQHPEKYIQYHSDFFFNTERFFKLRLHELNFTYKIERYPRRMFIAGVDGDGFTWATLSTNTLPEGVRFKYPMEYSHAKAVCFDYVQNIATSQNMSFLLSPPMGYATWNGKEINGWACDHDNPMASLNIRIIISDNGSINKNSSSSNNNNFNLQMLPTNDNTTKTSTTIEMIVRANKKTSKKIRKICNGGIRHTFFQPIPDPQGMNENFKISDTSQIQVFAIDPMDSTIEVKLLDTSYKPISQYLPIGAATWDGQHLSGWVCDLNNPRASLEIQIKISGCDHRNTSEAAQEIATSTPSSSSSLTSMHRNYHNLYSTTIRADQHSGGYIRKSCNGGRHHKFFWIIPRDLQELTNNYSFVKLYVLAALDPLNPQTMGVEIFNTTLSRD